MSKAVLPLQGVRQSRYHPDGRLYNLGVVANMLNTPFSPWPSYTEEEAATISRVLLSNKVNYWTGNETREFEKEFAEWCCARYAVAVSNGTVALEMALKAIGLKGGDEVIVTSRTFLASASAVVIMGGIPVFADIDPDSQNITSTSIEEVMTPKTKAIICVHLAGWPCEMDSIMELAEKNNLYVIEDCAQAHGARYKDRPVGSIGHVGAWSFCQDKIMTTAGEGGMITTNDHDIWSFLWSYKDHGKSWKVVYETQYPPGVFRWLHESFGTNARMTEIQAALGRLQLGYMKDWHNKRKANAESLLNTARKCRALRVPDVPDYIAHAWYKCYVFVRPDMLKKNWGRDSILAEINARGVPCYMGSCSEVYLEKAFDGTGYRPIERLEVAREVGDTSLMFLVHPTLTLEEIEKTNEVILSVMGEASLQ